MVCHLRKLYSWEADNNKRPTERRPMITGVNGSESIEKVGGTSRGRIQAVQGGEGCSQGVNLPSYLFHCIRNPWSPDTFAHHAVSTQSFQSLPQSCVLETPAAVGDVSPRGTRRF